VLPNPNPEQALKNRLRSSIGFSPWHTTGARL